MVEMVQRDSECSVFASPRMLRIDLQSKAGCWHFGSLNIIDRCKSSVSLRKTNLGGELRFDRGWLFQEDHLGFDLQASTTS